jgi:hypothetical protein
MGSWQGPSGLRAEGRFAIKEPEKHASAAKADVNFAGSMRGLKPPPPSGERFSAACKATGVGACAKVGHGPVDIQQEMNGLRKKRITVVEKLAGA